MFVIQKERLQKTLWLLQRTRCVYDGLGQSNRITPETPPPTFCDCKYNDGETVPSYSETGCGCPELRIAARILSSMTDAEYAMFLNRATEREYRDAYQGDWSLSTQTSVGAAWRLRRHILGNPAGAIGYVFSEYEAQGGKGIQLIFPNGAYDGFSPNEQENFLEYVEFRDEFSHYDFRSVMYVSEDFRKGYWKW